MSKRTGIRWTVVVSVAILVGGIFAIGMNSGQFVAMAIDHAAAAPARANVEGTVWNSPDNPEFPRLPALIVPVARPQ